MACSGGGRLVVISPQWYCQHTENNLLVTALESLLQMYYFIYNTTPLIENIWARHCPTRNNINLKIFERNTKNRIHCDSQVYLVLYTFIPYRIPRLCVKKCNVTYIRSPFEQSTVHELFFKTYNIGIQK